MPGAYHTCMYECVCSSTTTPSSRGRQFTHSFSSGTNQRIVRPVLRTGNLELKGFPLLRTRLRLCPRACAAFLCRHFFRWRDLAQVFTDLQWPYFRCLRTRIVSILSMSPPRREKATSRKVWSKISREGTAEHHIPVYW